MIIKLKCTLCIIVTFIVLLLSFDAIAFAEDQQVKAKQTKLSNGNSDINLERKIENLKVQAKKEIDINNNDIGFDSLMSAAIALAESTFDNEKVIDAYNFYFSLVSMDGPLLNFQNIVSRTEQITFENSYDIDKTELWLTISAGASRLNQPGIAHKFALKAFSEAELGKKPEKKVMAYLALGKSLQIQKYYIEAFQNFLNASYLTETIEEGKNKDKLRKKCFSQFFDFHRNVKDYDQAAKYKMLEIDIIQNNMENDSLELFWAKYDMCGLAILSKKYGSVVTSLDALLKYSENAKNVKLRDYSFSLYRQYLVQKNDLSGFHKIYVEKYPEELERLKMINPVLYFQIRSKLAEFKNDYLSARNEYLRAESQISQNDSPIFISNFYNRYGQFMLKFGKRDEAILLFQRAFAEAEKSQYVDYMLESSKFLDSLYSLTGNYAAAYKYSNINKKLLIQQAFQNKQDEFLRMELANESRQIALNQKRIDEEKRRKFNLQYFIITMSILFFFLVFIVFSKLKVPEWAIKGLGFLSVLMLFEFIILILDHEIHHFTHGAPLWIFAIKVLILIFLFPLHHLIEKAIIKFMIHNKQIWKPDKLYFRRMMHRLWPWMSDQDH